MHVFSISRTGAAVYMRGKVIYGQIFEYLNEHCGRKRQCGNLPDLSRAQRSNSE